MKRAQEDTLEKRWVKHGGLAVTFTVTLFMADHFKGWSIGYLIKNRWMSVRGHVSSHWDISLCRTTCRLIPIGNKLGTANMEGSETWKKKKKENTQMVFINYLKPTWTHIWLLLQIPAVERAYLSAQVIFRKLVLQHDEKVSDQTSNARGASLLDASDEWITGLPIYLDLTAESFPHGAAAFLSHLGCSPADRTRYSRTGTEGPPLGVLRLNLEISAENRGLLLAKTTQQLKVDD